MSDTRTWQGYAGSRITVTAANSTIRIEVTGDLGLSPDDALDLAEYISEQAAVHGTTIDITAPLSEGILLHPPAGIQRRMVAFLCEWLGAAVNYNETPFSVPADLGDGDTLEFKRAGEIHPYVLTVVRAGGKTPHQMRQEAEARLTDAVAAVHDIEHGALRWEHPQWPHVELLRGLRTALGIDEGHYGDGCETCLGAGARWIRDHRTSPDWAGRTVHYTESTS